MPTCHLEGDRLLRMAQIVSGNEILRALECGFKPDKIAFAGVGKQIRK